MATPIRGSALSWIVDHTLWDKAGARRGVGGALWATRKLFIALVGMALLTWQEWVEHHPPEIAIVAVLHLVFAFTAIALLVYARQWFRRGRGKPRNGE